MPILRNNNYINKEEETLLLDLRNSLMEYLSSLQAPSLALNSHKE